MLEEKGKEILVYFRASQGDVDGGILNSTTIDQAYEHMVAWQLRNDNLTLGESAFLCPTL